VAILETSRTSNHQPGKPERPRRDSDTTPRDEEVLAWEAIGDNLWLPRRVRGSFRGGALG
jgi:hypothetical protein